MYANNIWLKYVSILRLCVRNHAGFFCTTIGKFDFRRTLDKKSPHKGGHGKLKRCFDLWIPLSERIQWICGFHSRGRPKVWSTQIKPGTKFWDLFILLNMWRMTLWTARKRQFKRERSSRKKWRSSSSIVKTQWRCVQLTSLKAIRVERSWEYFTPQVGQKRLLQRKETNFMLWQVVQTYMAPPKEGSPQFSILSIFSISESLGWRVYLISS